MNQEGRNSGKFESGAERFLRWLGPRRPSVRVLRSLSLVFPILHALVCVWFIVVSQSDRESWPVWIVPLLAVNGISGIITGLALSTKKISPLVFVMSALVFGTTWISVKFLLGLTRLGIQETIITLSWFLWFASFMFFRHAPLENLAVDYGTPASVEVKEP